MKNFIENIVKTIIMSIIVFYAINFMGEKFEFVLMPIIILVLQAIWILVGLIIFTKNKVNFYLSTVYIIDGFAIGFIVTRIYNLQGNMTLFIYAKYVLMKSIANLSNLEYIIRNYFISILFIIISDSLLFIVIPVKSCLMSNKNNINNKKKNDTEKNVENVFKARINDFNKIKEFVNDNERFSLGIDSEYGSGKTYIIKQVELVLNDKDYIYIPSITANVDNVEKYIISELRNKLYKDGIYSKAFEKSMDIIRYIKTKIGVFTGNRLEDYIIEIRQLIALSNRRIVFIIDDLDRVYNFEIINKIFNIMELINPLNTYYGNNDSSQKLMIKCIYLYDIENLIEKYTKNNDVKDYGKYTSTYAYIRKYIDVEMYLTKLSDASIVYSIYDGEGADYLIKEINRINSSLRELEIPKNYNDYCRFNPRIIYFMLNEFDKIFQKWKYAPELLIDCLIFKYYFEKQYHLFVNQKENIDKFLDSNIEKPGDIKKYVKVSELKDIYFRKRDNDLKYNFENKKYRNVVICIIFNIFNNLQRPYYDCGSVIGRENETQYLNNISNISNAIKEI